MIIGLDLETTGLKAGEDRVIELCCGIYKDDGTFVKNVTLRFNPCRPIDPKAQAVHHITLEELMTCPKFEEKAELISKLLKKASLIVIHNARFDAPFLAAEFRRCCVEVPEVPVYDTMTENRWAGFDGKYPTLGELCWACDVLYNPKEAHAADYDVNAMMGCFFRIADWGFFNENSVMTPFNQIKPNERKQ